MRVRVLEVYSGTTARAAGVNDQHKEWRDNDVIDETNVREEGLDGTCFPQGVITPAMGRFNPYVNGTPFNFSTAGPWTVVNDGGRDVTAGPVTFSRADNQMLVVRASFEYRSGYNIAAPFIIGYRNGGAGPFTPILRTKRVVHSTGTGSANIPMRGSLTISHYFQAGGAGLDTSALYFALMQDATAAPITYRGLTLYTRVWTR